MNIEKIMSKNLVTVEMDDPLSVVKGIFDNTRFHHLLVIEVEILVGVISDRDLLKSVSPHLGTAAETSRDIETLNKKVHQIMSRKLITLKETAVINDAIQLFNSHTISCIPIIDEKGKPVGIVSWRDILKNLIHA